MPDYFNDKANTVMGIVDLYEGTIVHQKLNSIFFKFSSGDKKHECASHIKESMIGVCVPKSNGAHGLQLCVEILN